MIVWVLHCWALDTPTGAAISLHPSLEAAIYAALAWVVADRELVPQLRSVYTVCEAWNSVVE